MFRGGRDWPVACNEIPNLMMAPTKGAGHWVQIDVPEQVAAIMLGDA